MFKSYLCLHNNLLMNYFVFLFYFRDMFVKCVAFQTSGESNVFEPRFVSQQFDVVFRPTIADDAVMVHFHKNICRVEKTTYENKRNLPWFSNILHIRPSTWMTERQR